MTNIKYNSFGIYLAFFFLLLSANNANAKPYWESNYNSSTVRIDVIDDRGRYLRKFPTNSHLHILRLLLFPYTNILLQTLLLHPQYRLL